VENRSRNRLPVASPPGRSGPLSEAFEIAPGRLQLGPTIGVIDIGSNSVRLVVYEALTRSPTPIFNEKALCGLGRNVQTSGRLADDAVARALASIRRFRALCRQLRVDELHVLATAAVRDARNGDSFLARVRAETGWEPRLLSGEEEGYYGALGALNGVGLSEGFVIDLGGGSAQIIEVRAGLPGRVVSLPLGALRLSDLFLGYDRAKPAAVESLNQFLAQQLEGVDWFHAQPGDRLVALGGTVRNLARIDQATVGFPLEMVNGYQLAGANLHEMAGRFWRLSQKERIKTPGLDSDRADIIQSGALAYAALLAHSGFDSITISQQGLREGVFYERFLAGQPQPVFDDLRQFSVLNLARNFDCDGVHSRHVTTLSLQLFDQLQPAHGLDVSYRQLLWAAGMLHDIGMSIDFYYHHHHSAYIIQNSGLPGYSPRELAMIALLAQYHRKGSPKTGELGTLFGDEDHRALPLLAGMLRLAEFLERGRSQVRPAAGKIIIAQPAVILAPGVDHPANRFVGDGANGALAFPGAQATRAGVDQDHAGRRDDKTIVGVQAVVLGAALPQRTDDGIDLIHHLFGLGKVFGARAYGNCGRQHRHCNPTQSFQHKGALNTAVSNQAGHARACSRSEIRSPASSSPIDSRSMASEMPRRARSSGLRP